MTTRVAYAGPGRRGRFIEASRDTVLGHAAWLHAELSGFPPWTAARPVASHHALLVAATLPPRFDGGVFRPLSWLRYAPENGWRLSAVTRALDGTICDAGRQLSRAIPADSILCHAPPLPLRPSLRLFQDIDGSFLTALALYRAGAARFAIAPPSIVIATGPSFAAFVAGRLLARHFGARLVLDYRDEWTENPFDFVHQGRNDRWWEQRCLAAADLVQFTTESQRQHAEAAFPGLIGSKGVVLHNGWEPDPGGPAILAAQPASGRWTIAYSGVLGAMASPAAFLRDLAKAVADVPRLRGVLRLRFIGRRLREAERTLSRFPYPEMLDLIDQRPRAEADRLMRKSDALLLLSGSKMARYLQGKLFEYLAAGRPILVHGHDGEGPALVRQLAAGLHVGTGNSAGLAHALARFINAPAGAWNGACRQVWIQDHTRQGLARQFFGSLDRLVESDRCAGPAP